MGPDFVPPAPPTVQGYVPAPTPPLNLTAGAGEPFQHLVSNQTIEAEWWHLFHSPELDKVVREAIAGSPSLEAATAALAQAQQAVVQVRGGYFPQVDLAAGAERQRGPAFALGLLPSASQTGLPLFNLYTFGPSINFTPDVFGLTARQVERQEALAEYQEYQLAAAHLTLTGNVVAQALSIAAARQQIQALREIIADDETSLSLTRARHEAGKIARNEVLVAEAQLNSDRALLPPLEQQLTAVQDALSALVGKSPAEWTAPEFDLAGFVLPPELPVSLPSTLVRQRPDILAATAQLHADSAAIGVATAQMYPNFPLSASIDAAALSTTSLVNRPSLVWTLSGGLTAPIFHGGALEAQKQAAVDGFQATLARYRQTVLQALSQVADLLRALEHDAQLVETEAQALRIAKEALALQRASYAIGRGGLLPVVEARRKAQQARLGFTRAQAQRLLDSAQLMVAMGGGWWQEPASCTSCRPPPTGANGERK